MSAMTLRLQQHDGREFASARSFKYKSSTQHQSRVPARCGIGTQADLKLGSERCLQIHQQEQWLNRLRCAALISSRALLCDLPK